MLADLERLKKHGCIKDYQPIDNKNTDGGKIYIFELNQYTLSLNVHSELKTVYDVILDSILNYIRLNLSQKFLIEKEIKSFLKETHIKDGVIYSYKLERE